MGCSHSFAIHIELMKSQSCLSLTCWHFWRQSRTDQLSLQPPHWATRISLSHVRMCGLQFLLVSPVSTEPVIFNQLSVCGIIKCMEAAGSPQWQRSGSRIQVVCEQTVHLKLQREEISNIFSTLFRSYEFSPGQTSVNCHARSNYTTG